MVAPAGFLLAVLWFDLMFDMQARGATVDPAAVQSISAYYRRVTTDARPMNYLVSTAMVATLAAISVEIATGDHAAWIGGASLALALVPMVIAGTRTVPRAVRLGAATDSTDDRTIMARTTLREHVFCFISIAALIAVQLARAA